MEIKDLTPEQIEQFKTAESAEELKTVAAEQGIAVTDEEIAFVWKALKEQDINELSDNELENVAGGCGENPHQTWSGPNNGFSEYTTNNNCPVCATPMSFVRTTRITSGQYREIFQCPKGKVSFMKVPNSDMSWKWAKC